MYMYTKYHVNWKIERTTINFWFTENRIQRKSDGIHTYIETSESQSGQNREIHGRKWMKSPVYEPGILVRVEYNPQSVDPAGQAKQLYQVSSASQSSHHWDSCYTNVRFTVI